MRITAKEALDRGLIDQKTAKAIEQSGKRSSSNIGETVAKLNADRLSSIDSQPSPSPKVTSPEKSASSGRQKRQCEPGSKEYRESENSPQKLLFDALCARIPGRPQWEVGKLIPGRKFTADIFIAPRVVVEMDGFGFHSSKSAFQKDRERQNLFVMHGYRVIRAYAGQIFDRERLADLVDLIAQTTELDP